ncbi:carbohydrate kinase [Microbacterium saccharophilum]|uniref:Carbohydrate kinase n=1 Tax=Microbacterium saccharophilum TaxID=1213358 RepID=A0A5C8HSZ7_9MICO|nr:PfkB family carbohydrate kinase [Microbacterium saccharophilum]TXK08929.1 carbohydrate kinase [Microbacterium saccharophilum]GEP48044.1 fructokinase [Microbacterium saccharophilum]
MSEAQRVLVIGEALIDVVGGVEIVGGSPSNAALGLGRLGVKVDLLTALARDERGERIRTHLEDSGVRVLPESFSLERTSTARATVMPDGSAEYEFDVTWQVQPVDVSAYGVVHVGSIGSFVEPGACVVRGLVRSARLEGARVTFDPNVRPALLGSQDAVARADLIARFSAAVKLSEEDAQALYPRLPLDKVADRLHELGPDLVAITRGGDGSILSTRTARVVVAAPSVDVVDTVGAGDTYMAALIASLLAEADWDLGAERLNRLGEFCATAAAITVGRSGADLPTRSDLEPTSGLLHG